MYLPYRIHLIEQNLAKLTLTNPIPVKYQKIIYQQVLDFV